MSRIDLESYIGNIYNNYTILSFEYIKIYKKSKQPFYKCLCKCGKESIIGLWTLRSLKGKMCNNCKSILRTLPNGSGYLYIRQAVRKVIDMFRGLCDNFILIGHTKDKLINKNGEEMAEMSLDLVGALANIICGEADAVGYVYRKKNETHISFEGGDNSVIEARAPHLRGKNIVVAESDENNNITTYWNKVYLPE